MWKSRQPELAEGWCESCGKKIPLHIRKLTADTPESLTVRFRGAGTSDIYNPPEARGYGIHQDWIAWPGFPRSFPTVLIALDEADAANGCTSIFAGMHRNGSYQDSPDVFFR